MNAVLERLLRQRDEQLTFVDQLLNRVDAESRDLVQAEKDNLQAARQRIGELDDQIKPLQEFDDLRSASAAGHPLGAPGPRHTQPVTAGNAPQWATAGAYLADYCRARGIGGGAPDAHAMARLERAAVDNQITTDTPGLLPQPVVGSVVNVLDAFRPFITSIGGAINMGGIPGAVFTRPKVTQHTKSGKQTAEKTQLTSRRMKIDPVPFAKETHGGVVDISRQDIDWTSPSAWDALVQDLANVYGVDTETSASNAFATAITQTQAAVTADLKGIAAALYAAAAKCYVGGAAAGEPAAGLLPDRIWMSLDMWAQVGPIVDLGRLAFPPTADGTAGSSELSTFSGDMLNVPRIVVPSFPAATIIIGNSTLTEVYEEVVGMISAIEPALFGVEVAYGGYLAFGTLVPAAYCKVTLPTTP